MFEDKSARLREVGACRSEVVAEEESSAVEVDVGEEKRHRPALGDLPRFIEVRSRFGNTSLERSQPRTGKEATGEEVQRAGAPESVHCIVDVLSRSRMRNVARSGLKDSPTEH